jgi:hypothetical protein
MMIRYCIYLKGISEPVLVEADAGYVIGRTHTTFNNLIDKGTPFWKYDHVAVFTNENVAGITKEKQ